MDAADQPARGNLRASLLGGRLLRLSLANRDLLQSAEVGLPGGKIAPGDRRPPQTVSGHVHDRGLARVVCDPARPRVSRAVLRSHFLRGRMEVRLDGAKARAAPEPSAVVGSIHEIGGRVGRPHGARVGWPAGTQASVDRPATHDRLRTRLAFVWPRSPVWPGAKSGGAPVA